VCAGTEAPARADDALALVPAVGADIRQLSLLGLASTNTASWVALWATSPVFLSSPAETDGRRLLFDPVVDGGCALGFVRWPASGASPVYHALGGYRELCPDATWAAMTSGAVALADDSFVLGGLLSGRLPLASGRERAMGVSPNGLAPDKTAWLARIDARGQLLWTVEALGVADLEIPSRMVASHDGQTLYWAPTLAGGVKGELVDGLGATFPVAEVAGQAGSVIYRLDLAGRVQEWLRVTASPGGALVTALRPLDGGAVVAAGMVGGGVVNFEREGNVVGQAPTGLVGDGLEAWIVHLGPDGTPKWAWGLFPRLSYTGPVTADGVMRLVPGLAPDSDGRIWFGIQSSRPLDGRSGADAAVAISPTWPDTAAVRTTLIQIDLETGELVRAVVLDALATDGLSWRGQPYFTGVFDGEPSGVWDQVVPAPGAVGRPFVAAVDRWSEVLATGAGRAGPLVEVGDALQQPILAANAIGLVTAFQTSAPFTTTTRAGPTLVPEPAVVVRRLDVGGAQDCPAASPE
jgi:hypothetical protein